jgi:hypothetical protein
MLNPLRWLEQKIITGKVIHDYGPISESSKGTIGKVVEKHTLLLCRKGKKDMIVIRHFYRALLAVRISYTQIPAENAEKIIEMLIDLAARRGPLAESNQNKRV